MKTDKNFSIGKTSDTGRYFVISERTGKKYLIEPIGNGRTADWGSVDPATGDLMVKKGWGKHTGSVEESESVITKENGFEKIHYTGVGGSPSSLVEQLDSQYPDKIK